MVMYFYTQPRLRGGLWGGGVCCEFSQRLSSVAVAAVPYIIQRYIATRYNGTQLNIQRVELWMIRGSMTLIWRNCSDRIWLTCTFAECFYISSNLIWFGYVTWDLGLPGMWHLVCWLKIMSTHDTWHISWISGLILGLHPANERRRYKVTPSLNGWAQS